MQTEREKAELELSQMEEVAKSFNTAMKGIGTDEDRIIREISKYNNIQRQLIKSKYLTLFGKTLEEDIKSELNGNFLEAVLGLLTPVAEYEASILEKAMQGMGTNEKKITEILCSKDAQEIKVLREAYKRLYGREIEADLRNEQGGDLGRLYRSIASGGRSENHGYDQNLVKSEAQQIYDAGQGKVGTDEQEIIRILCSRSFPQLNAIFSHYFEICKTDIEDALKKELGGELLNGCLTIVKNVRNRSDYYAELLYNSMQGAGTKERDLLQILIRRSDIDMKAIKKTYESKYKRSLIGDVKNEVSGEFEKLLVALLEK